MYGVDGKGVECEDVGCIGVEGGSVEYEDVCGR